MERFDDFQSLLTVIDFLDDTLVNGETRAAETGWKMAVPTPPNPLGPIVDGVGTVRIGDTVWRVNGPDGPAGSRVKVTRTDGANLIVEPTA